MPNRTECIADEGRLHLVKLAREQPRDLVVDVISSTDRRVATVPFTRDAERITIDGLDQHETYRVRVHPAGRLGRYRRTEGSFTVRPQQRTLRLLVTGTGRCGTQTLAQYLDGQCFTDGTRVHARHQPLDDWMLDAFLSGDWEFPVLQQQGALHNAESAPYYSIYPDVIRAERVILIIRDGRRVVQSGLNRGWYVRDTRWNAIKPDYQAEQFESCCRLWVDCNTNAAARADRIFRLEDLRLGQEELAAFDSAAGLIRNDRQLPHANRGAQTSTGRSWTPEDNETFEQLCGEMMDVYYTGWREQV